MFFIFVVVVFNICYCAPHPDHTESLPLHSMSCFVWKGLFFGHVLISSHWLACSPAHSHSRVDCVTHFSLLLWFLPSSKFIFVVEMSRRVCQQEGVLTTFPHFLRLNRSAGLIFCCCCSLSRSLKKKLQFRFGTLFFSGYIKNYIHSNILFECGMKTRSLTELSLFGCSSWFSSRCHW